MHKLLERQVRRHFGMDVPAALQPFLDTVSQTYTESDADRKFVEHSLELTSQELLQRNSDLRAKQREQQIIFDAVPALIIYKDTQNRILRLNESAARALGSTAQALEGRRTDEVLPPEVAAALYQDDLRVIETGQPRLGIIESHPGPDGSLHWLRTDKVPYLDESGSVIGVIVFSVDITERKKAEQALAASEEQHRLIVETATEGIWTLDLQGKTTFANSVMAHMLGCSRDEMLGRDVFEFIPPEDRDMGAQKLQNLLSGTRVALDFRFRRKDGTDVWTQASGAPMKDAAGNVVGALGMLTDITKRRDAEQSLQSAYKRLQQLDHERTQFLNNAAHELGTPLTPIKLQIHLLRSRMNEQAQADAKAVDILDRNFERLSHLVRDLLDSARLQATSLKLHPAPVDLARLIEASVETYAAPAADVGVHLRTLALPHAQVRVDASRISQVLDNLLSNAVKFTPRGKNVEVGVRIEDSRAHVFVRDQGLGMDPQGIAKLFHPFVQLHDTMQSTRGGTGLGLYICHGLVAAHGGSIRAESAGLGHGSTFTFDLPLMETSAGKLAAVHENSRPA